MRSAYYRLKQQRTALSCRDVDFQLHMYTTYIRPLVESNSVIWSPNLLRDIDKIEGVQRLFTRKLPGLQNIPYHRRLNITQLKSLEERRIIFDLLYVFKIVHKMVDVLFENLFTFNRNNTRGHNFKLYMNHSRVNYRKYFFCNRVIPIWNELPSEVAETESFEVFKRSLHDMNFTRYCRGHALMAQ